MLDLEALKKHDEAIQELEFQLSGGYVGLTFRLLFKAIKFIIILALIKFVWTHL